jgi:hypothetical protein
MVVPRRGKSDLTDVEVEVEVRILDPLGKGEPERDLRELARERREHVDALGDQRPDVVGGQGPAWRRARVIDGQTADVAKGSGVSNAKNCASRLVSCRISLLVGRR